MKYTTQRHDIELESRDTKCEIQTCIRQWHMYVYMQLVRERKVSDRVSFSPLPTIIIPSPTKFRGYVVTLPSVRPSVTSL